MTEVTVFSDRARVVRTASVSGGAQTLELPPLPQTVDPQSVRVEASGTEVKRVDLARLEDDALPTDEAKKLIAELQRVDDALARLYGESAALDVQVAQLQRLNPQPPNEASPRAATKLNASGWTQALAFVSDTLAKAQTRKRELAQKSDALVQERQLLAEKARLLGASAKRFGWKVTAQLAGGAGTVKLTYFVTRARWYPVYDLALNSDTGQVAVSFSGLVSQESGEDWSDAALRLSTAVPTTQATLPKLLTWKIGERERFIPTPTPVREGVRPVPMVPPLPRVPKEEDMLRSQLLQVAAEQVIESQAVGAMARGAAGPTQLDFADDAEESRLSKSNAPMAAPLPPAAPPMPKPSAEAKAVQMTSIEMAAPTFDFSLAPPSAYRGQPLSADLPAVAGGGYDLVYPSLQKETVPSGKGVRKVALFTEAWPVKVERKLYPALFPEAFLVAELKNPSTQPLPAGNASLFVGDDPSGTARLKLVSPGEALTLPLGIDRSLRPVRNVKVVQSEEGIVSKDEVSRYTVTIELANPYRAAMNVRMVDQLPVTQDKDVAITLLESKPMATQDSRTGALEWRLNVAPAQKTVVAFTYTVKRPKGWKLYQSEERP